MGFVVSSVPFEVKTGQDLTSAQRAQFASDFELTQRSGSVTSGHLAVWDGVKLVDGGTPLSGGGFVAKKPAAISGNFGAFDSSGDLQDSGSKPSDFAPASALNSFVRVHTSLSDLGVTSMDSADWVANANAIVTALITEGGLLDIPYLFGSGGETDLASSIASTGTNGGTLSFSPQTGRLTAHLMPDGTGEVVFQCWREGNFGTMSTKLGAAGGSGVNWKWSKILLDTGEDTSPWQPKFVGYLSFPNEETTLNTLFKDNSSDTWSAVRHDNATIIILKNGSAVDLYNSNRIIMGSQGAWYSGTFYNWSFAPWSPQSSADTGKIYLTANGSPNGSDYRPRLKYSHIAITIF